MVRRAARQVSSRLRGEEPEMARQGEAASDPQRLAAVRRKAREPAWPAEPAVAWAALPAVLQVALFVVLLVASQAVLQVT
jgi:hypothetical protein